MQVKPPDQQGQKRIPHHLYANLDGHFGSRRSAQEVVPVVLDLIQPQSVVDVGCGVGSWLAVFSEAGIDDILGVDVEYLDRSLLKIPQQCFRTVDLKQPLELGRSFDLAVCLEVAGYLPEEYAETFINSLVSLSPVILFSSAIPFQDPSGLQVNQQWPPYWINLFQAKNYTAIDCLRKRFWHNNDVAYWFVQNMFLFVQQDYLKAQERLQQELERNPLGYLNLVHPRCYQHKCDRLYGLKKTPPSVKEILSQLLARGKQAIKKRLG